MLEKNAYCTDILTQVAAVNAALNSFNKVLLADHIRTCVADNIREGNDEVVDELGDNAAETDEVIIRKCQQGQKKSQKHRPHWKNQTGTTPSPWKGENYGTIQRDRHELRCPGSA